MSETGENARTNVSILRNAEEKVMRRWEKEFPSPSPLPDHLIQEYSANKDYIADLYKKTAYWHGTGRMQYKNGNVVDILESLITAKGLVPEKDKFDLGKGEMTSTSITNRRMYASLYAKMHDTNDAQLAYEYFPKKFWSNVYLAVVGRLAGNELFSGTTVIDKVKMGIKFANNWRNWFKKIMRHPPLKPSLSKARSDIPGNYPVLLGINDSVSTTSASDYISAYETRVDKPIPIDSITHIEVPLSQMGRTIDFLKKKGVTLPIIPMEYGEIFSSQFTPRQHVAGNPFKEI